MLLRTDTSTPQAKDQHWAFIQKLADELKVDVVVPIYPLAPLSTATECTETAVELLARLQQDDPRYRGKQIVLCGDSAGGWIVTRVLLALVERHAGKRTFRDREGSVSVFEIHSGDEGIDYQAILDSITDVIRISPLVDVAVDRQEDVEAEQRVSWISIETSI